MDTYAYDLGYHMSYGLTTFAIAMMFSTLVPYVPAFAVVFFLFKYYVDKYNLSFVYNSEFRGTGVIRKKVIPLSIFNIIMVQIVNVGFFAGKQGQGFLWFGVAVIVVELVVIVVYHWSAKRANFLRHQRRRRGQYAMSPQEELDPLAAPDGAGAPLLGKTDSGGSDFGTEADVFGGRRVSSKLAMNKSLGSASDGGVGIDVRNVSTAKPQVS